MPLTPGTRIGSCEITGSLGAGGMGEVYRARDMKLNRDVAIKILPDLFATDPDRLARFQREAQVLAVLNHQNIAQVHGLEDLPPSRGSHSSVALVMEFVDGEDLAARLRRGPIPVDEAILIARQIADALEAAHEHGIIHRDLKPANIKLASDGTVKVLDFGLAKAVAGPGSPALENSPTFTSPAVMTQMGVIMGTAAYMAPEQAKGKTVDRRADIWAFGCVLYEILTGRAPFAADSVGETIGLILTREPDRSVLPAALPPAVSRLIDRCLVKDPRQRLRDIGEARLVLEQPAAYAPASSTELTRQSRATRVLAAATAVLAVALLACLVWLLRDVPAPDRRLTMFDVQPPAGVTLNLARRPAVAVSPDGSVLAVIALENGVSHLYVRRRDQADLRQLPGTDDATNPAFSRDGKWVSFYAGGALRKVPLDGAPVTVAPVSDLRGSSWADDGSIIYTPGPTTGLLRVASDGGTPQAVTTLAAGERSHRWPQALPGGKAAIFTVGTVASPDRYDDAAIGLVILATGERRVVLQGASMARFVPTGHLIFARGPALYAVPFDIDRLTTRGSAVQIVANLGLDATTGAAHFDCADDGTLAYVKGSAIGDLNRIVWVDRSGVVTPLQLPDENYNDVKVSPDGTRAVFVKGVSGSADLWTYDFRRKMLTRLTFTATSAGPIWSSDGRNVFYTAFDTTGRKATLLRKPADGSRDAEVVRALDNRAYVDWVAPDVSSGIFDYYSPPPGGALAPRPGDIVRFSFNVGAQPVALVATPANEFAGAVSPDRRWLAYVADETGRREVYVRDIAGPGARWQISNAGGEEPRWSPKGDELFYRAENRLMAVSISTRTIFENGTPQPLFDGVYKSGTENGRSFDVDPKGGRFLMIRPADTSQGPATVRVVLNWLDELRRIK